jgi:hypothetical protein
VPALRTQIEDAVIAALTPLKLPGKGGGAQGYLATLKPYQGPPTPESDDVKRLLDGGGPALLVTTEDARFFDWTPRRRLAEVTFELVVYLLADHQRGFEARARGDVRSSETGKDPGVYQIIEDVRGLLFGADLGLDCVKRPRVTSETSLGRATDWAVWRLAYEVDATVEGVNPLAAAVYATELAIDVNQAGDATADPVVEADRDLDVPGVEFYDTTAPAEVTSYTRASPATAITSVGPTGPVITEFADGEYAYGVDDSFEHAGERGAFVPVAAENLISRSQDASESGPWSFAGLSEVPANTPEAGPLGLVSDVLFSTSGDIWATFASPPGVAVPGQVYCFSVYARAADPGQLPGGSPAASITLRADTGALALVEEQSFTLQPTWTRHFITWTQPADETAINLRLVFPGLVQAMWLPQAPQWEVGAVPTPWIRVPSGFGQTASRVATVIDFESEGNAGRIENLGAGPVLTLGDSFFALRDSEVAGDLVAKAIALP